MSEVPLYTQNVREAAGRVDPAQEYVRRRVLPPVVEGYKGVDSGVNGVKGVDSIVDGVKGVGSGVKGVGSRL